MGHLIGIPDNSRGSERQPNLDFTSHEALLVSMSTTPRCSSLRSAGSEVQTLSDLLENSMSKVPLEKPLKEEVLAKLKSCKIFHFADHGKSNLSNPL
jgi:hypothetical protein